MTAKKLRITNTETGKVWEGENLPHRWNEIALEAKLDLCYSDIEMIIKDPHEENGWIMLDECGSWSYLPSIYKVEEIPEDEHDITIEFNIGGNKNCGNEDLPDSCTDCPELTSCVMDCFYEKVNAIEDKPI